MSFFARGHLILQRVSQIAVWVGGAALMLAAVMVTIDVFSRKLFGVTMSGSDEITGYVFAAATTWAYSYCLLFRTNVRIDAFYGKFPPGLRALMDVLGLGLLLLFMGYLTRKAVDVFVTSWERDSVSVTTLAIPLWIPQLVWLMGLLLFCFTLVFVLLYAVLSLVRKDLETVQRVAGALSAEEEIAHETRGLGANNRDV
ncbi:MAG: TRAP transporter small permease [Burkholderiaceae bacterium]